MMVVSDTSPFNYLVQIGHVDIRPRLFGTVLTPPAVIAELGHALSPESVRTWAGRPPEWLVVRRATASEPIPGVDLGEGEALALAIEVRADVVLVDDARGRLVATRLNLNPKGTLGVHSLAAEIGMIDLDGAMDRLGATSFRAPPA